eukprot:7069141-Prymnesium_polylepis.1
MAAVPSTAPDRRAASFRPLRFLLTQSDCRAWTPAARRSAPAILAAYREKITEHHALCVLAPSSQLQQLVRIGVGTALSEQCVERVVAAARKVLWLQLDGLVDAGSRILRNLNTHGTVTGSYPGAGSRAVSRPGSSPWLRATARPPPARPPPRGSSPCSCSPSAGGSARRAAPARGSPPRRRRS